MENNKKAMPEENLPPKRCGSCNRLLFYGYVKAVQIKCPKCGKLIFFND